MISNVPEVDVDLHPVATPPNQFLPVTWKALCLMEVSGIPASMAS